MKKFGFIILAIGVVAFLNGCGKKQQSLEEMQEPMSMEVLNMINKSTPAGPGVPEVKPPAASNQAAPAQVAPVQPAAEPLPPVGSYAKPSIQEIQTALKNAGFYVGNVDGKIGPKTKKAVEDFQKANGLTVDGKVGPKTWAAMAKHLTAAPAADASATQR